MENLLDTLKSGGDLSQTPNLLWKSSSGQIIDNGYTYKPQTYDHGIDRSHLPGNHNSRTLLISETIALTNIGCLYNRGWCGGSREAFLKANQIEDPLFLKPTEAICCELSTLNSNETVQLHFYPVSTYNEQGQRLEKFLDLVAKLGWDIADLEALGTGSSRHTPQRPVDKTDRDRQ